MFFFPDVAEAFFFSLGGGGGGGAPCVSVGVVMAPTGVTVVTGFLGAGKTTLVNYVLNADHGYRVAVILNDFGAQLGVEKMLVQDKPDGDNAVEEWVELNNGCVCCTVKGTLVQTIDNLLEKRASTGRKFDFILLETTGLADPGPVAQELWVDDEILEDDGAVLDAVVTLVDASNIERQLSEGKEASLQIAHADTVVLNKCDLVSERDLERVSELVAGINAEAKIVRSTRSVVDLGVILNQGAVSSAGRKAGVRPTLAGDLAQTAPAPGFWARGVEKYASRPLSDVHDASIRTVCLVADGRIDVGKFETWLEELLWEHGGPSGAHEGDEVEAGGGHRLEVLRAKGVLFAAEDEGTDRRRVLQAVREVYEITEGPPGSLGERPLNRVVLIGRGLMSREEELLGGLKATTTTADA